MIGWSRTGNYVGFTLTHSAHPFAAAMLIDTNDFGWWNYLGRGAREDLEVNYGSAPFGAGLERWLEQAPSFAFDRVRAPVMMLQTTTVTELWDWYAALRRLRKPVEYWFFPDGVHQFFRIEHRLRANRLLVDWFAFWLLGREDSAPVKAEQYRRWRELRSQQDAVLAQPRPPLLDWSARQVP
jgi:dipeptidyl aminopeptidase/acylaminoacyl peptidase